MARGALLIAVLALQQGPAPPRPPVAEAAVECRFVHGGRSWYTGMGHTSESYAEPRLLAHLPGGIPFAAGWPDCDTPPRTRAVPPR